jgi:pimeloyl-ACP methyl ester carboxylesterase
VAVLAFDDRGAGQPLVFLHGITASRNMWEPIVSLMERNHRCINVDLPGHGESPDGGYGPVDQAAAVRSVVDELALDQPLVIGHSLGAMTATVYAALYGARGVVNVDQPLHLGTFVAMLGPDLERFRDGRFTEAFDEFAAQLGIDLVPEPRRSAALADVKPRQEVVVALWADMLDGNANNVQPLLDDALTAIGCPYLAIFGSSLTSAARTAAEQIPNVTIEVWDGTGHLLHLVDPDRFVQRVETFEASLG